MSLKLKVFSLPSAVRSALLGLVGYLTACGSNPTLLGDRTMDAGSGLERDGESPATPDAANRGRRWRRPVGAGCADGR